MKVVPKVAQIMSDNKKDSKSVNENGRSKKSQTKGQAFTREADAVPKFKSKSSPKPNSKSKLDSGPGFESKLQDKSKLQGKSKGLDAGEIAKVPLQANGVTSNLVGETTIEGDSPVKLDEKLQKVLARVGLGSRREMERQISAGNVNVNGQKATLGDRVTQKDTIELNGKRVKVVEKEAQRLRVILYNKPEGQICSRSDPEGRASVYEGLPRLNVGRWISVGRLDFNTSGLLLFTNDGEMANKLMHPSSNIDREYLVRIHGNVDDEMLKRLRKGVMLDDGMAQFSDIKNGAEEGSNRWFYCVVMEGRNREVRRLWESQGVKVSRLKRVRYGNIFIPSHVRVGQWLELNDKEISDLALTAGMSAPKKPRFSPKIEQTRDRHQRKLRAAAGISKPNPRQKKNPRK